MQVPPAVQHRQVFSSKGRSQIADTAAHHVAVTAQETPASASTHPACEPSSFMSTARLQAVSQHACYGASRLALRRGFDVHRYDEPACKWKQDELDHSVMLVGYGTTESGKDHWTIK
jgi:hypothetical protein